VRPHANHGVKDGRFASYSATLDEARHEELVLERPDVDVSAIVTTGRNERIVRTRYATDSSEVAYFASDVRSLVASLAKTLPDHRIDVVDSSLDASRLLIFASSDVDPGFTTFSTGIRTNSRLSWSHGPRWRV
jgi:hypothetical protein